MPLADDLDALIGHWSTVAGLALLGYVATCGLLTLASGLPGWTGRLAAGASRWLTPRAVRVLLAAALGGGGSVGIPAVAHAADGNRLGAGRAVPDLDRPASNASAAPAVTSEASVLDPPRRRPPVVVVRPGDSLWAIASRAAGPTATKADVARLWPRWWAANRAVVGPDPHQLIPGQHLLPPRPQP